LQCAAPTAGSAAQGKVDVSSTFPTKPVDNRLALAPPRRTEPSNPRERVENSASGLVDVQAVAEYLAVSRGWVYEHAELLRARRLGTGPKARLRFSLEDVDAALTCSAGRESAHPSEPVVEPFARR